MKKVIRRILNFVMKLFITNDYKKISQKINEYDYVSFDMFDTLIKRNVYSEKDIFKIVEKMYNKTYSKRIDFYSARIKAEKDARCKSKYCEVTIDEIYDYLNISDAEVNVLKKIEKYVEIEMCTPNKRMKKIFDECIKKSKKIYVTSDMYLDEETITKMLDKCGYNHYTKLYLSSKERKQKKNHQLYDLILKNEKIKKNKFIHIGDNCVSDYLIPKINGLNAILIKKDIINIKSYKKDYLKDDLYYNYLTIMANNIVEKKCDIIEEISYPILSELICSFCLSLKKYISENSINKIFFLARDAKIIMDSYLLLYPEDKKIVEYMYISRKAMLFPGMSTCSHVKDFKKILEAILGKNFIVNQILELFKIQNVEKFDNIKNNIFNSCKFEIQNQIFDFIIEMKQKDFEEQSKNLQDYLKQIEFNNNVCLVDIGWRGSIQNILVDFCKNNNMNVNIQGYYLGLINKTNFIGNGLLFDKNKLNNYEINKIILSISFFETMFLNTEGSTISYKKINDVIEPVKKDKDNSKEIEEIFNSIHNNVLKFIKQININIITNLYNDDLFYYMYNYEKLIVYPKLKTIKFIKKINFEDNGNKKIINNKNLLFYLLNIKQLKKDLLDCKYKIGFFKNLFFLPINYYTILNIIKKKVGDK